MSASEIDRYAGNDNRGEPKSAYIGRLAEMDDAALAYACEQMIWLSAYAANNRRSDYHWQCDAAYDECKRRGKPEIYSAAHERASLT